MLRVVRALCSCLFLAIAGCSPADKRDAVPADLMTYVAFVGVNVVPMTHGDSLLENRTVVVHDGRIVSIDSSPSVDARAQIIDARGKYLMPGLVDAHVHLEYFDDPGVLVLFLANGVTSIRNMDGRPYILDWKRQVASRELLGPSIYTAGPVLDGDPPARDDNTVVRNAAEAEAAVATQLAAGYDFVKVYRNLSRDSYFGILKAAMTHNLPVAGHVPREVTLREVLTSGQHSVEHLSDFDELIEADSSSVRGRFHWSKLYLAMTADSAKINAAARETAASGAWIVPTLIQAERGLGLPDSVSAWLATSEMVHVPADGIDFWKDIAKSGAARMDSNDWNLVARGRENRKELVRAMHVAGVKLALGTDTPNPFVVPGFSVHDELGIFVSAGLSPREALMLATSRPAELMHTTSTAGTVEVGKNADLLLLAGNPLIDVAVARRPVGVMVRGKWLPAAELETMLKRTVLSTRR